MFTDLNDDNSYHVKNRPHVVLDHNKLGVQCLLIWYHVTVLPIESVQAIIKGPFSLNPDRVEN